MDVSPKTLREVEFREKMRGYHPEDVDQFLEQVAVGLEALHDRLRQAVERAQRAEAAAPSSEASDTDETLRRTLVLAQRTADLAVQEAREQASRILASAEQQAQTMLSDADERARRTHDEAVSAIRSELGTLEAVRQRGQQEVDLLSRWVEEHRDHLAATLKDALSVVERAGMLSPAPVSRTIDSGPSPMRPSPRVALPPPGDPGGAASDPGPPTTTWTGPDQQEPKPARDGEAQFGSVRRAGDADAGGRDADAGGRDTGATDVVGLEQRSPVDPREQALDDFFEDGDYDEEHRFGGRLRRRR